VQTASPRSGIVAFVASAAEPREFCARKSSQDIASLHDIICNNWAITDKPELCCFGLLESFDMPQLKALAEKMD